MQDLKVSLIQTNNHWHDVEANLSMFESKIATLQDTDVILLPEMFSTGFTMATELAEEMGGRAFQWMKLQAKDSQALLLGSIIVKENGKVYNRLIWMEPDGNYATYDKRHLFRMAEEDKYYAEGSDLLIKEWKGWRICPQICYDLRFPVFSRNGVDAAGTFNYDLLLYVANWPAARSQAWDVLLQARAVENWCYCIGLNRIGRDGKDIEYDGHSAVVDAKGQRLFYNEKEDVVHTALLDADSLQRYREKFPAYLDADDFTLNL